MKSKGWCDHWIIANKNGQHKPAVVYRNLNPLFVAVVSAIEPATIAATATAGCIGAWAGLIYDEVFAHKIRTVQFIDCLTGRGIVAHFDKAKSTASLGEFVQDDLCRAHLPERFK